MDAPPSLGAAQHAPEHVLPGVGQLSEEELALLAQYASTAVGRGKHEGDVPDNLEALLKNVKRSQGRPTQEDEGVDIVPEPGFVIKTVDAATGNKVFINVCGSSHVPAPAGWSAAAVPEHVARTLDDLNHQAPDALAEAEEVLRFPLSAGPLRSDTDRSGSACSVADCVLNDVVLAACQQHRPLKAFLIEVLLGHVADKHKLSLDSRFKLPSMRYKGGTVQAQRMRKERKPLVTELSTSPVAASASTAGRQPAQPPDKHDTIRHAGSMRDGNAATATVQAASKRGQPLATCMPQQEEATAQVQASIRCTGRPVQHVVVNAQLPPSAPWQGLCTDKTTEVLTKSTVVEICGPIGEVLHLSAPGCSPLQLQLPFSVSAAGARAELQLAEDSGCRTVVVNLPVVPVGAVLTQMATQCPAQFSIALVTSAAQYIELE